MPHKVMDKRRYPIGPFEVPEIIDAAQLHI